MFCVAKLLVVLVKLLVLLVILGSNLFQILLDLEARFEDADAGALEARY